MALVSGIQYSTEITSRKNFIINGNFDIWQRGTSFVTPSNGDYFADRWKAWHNIGAVTVSRSTDVPSLEESGIKSNYSLLVDVTTADTSITGDDLFEVAYQMEGYDYAQLAGGNATLSFWVKATKTGTYCVGIKNDAGTRSYIKEYTVNVADTWEKKILNFPLDGDDGPFGSPAGGDWNYTNGSGLYILFPLAAGSTYQTTADAWQNGDYAATANQVNAFDSTSNNFQLAQVQFERGTVATDLEQRHIAEELAMCQRYFERLSFDTNAFSGVATMMANGTTEALGELSFTPKRTAGWAGSVSNTSHFNIYNGANNSVSAFTFNSNSLSKDRCTISITTTGQTAGQAVLLNTNNTTSGYIDIDAEL